MIGGRYRLEQPIGFDAPDEKPVNLLIFLLVPEAATQKHLEILSEIAELLSDAPLREKIRHSTDAKQLHQLSAEQLRTLAAHVTGVLAHKTSDAACEAVQHRLADRIGHRPAVQA